MDFELPKEITDKLAELDAFIEAEIKPLERENIQFFDHRREHARTDWDDDGRPRTEWRALISEMERRADRAGHLRYGLPKSCGGQAASNLAIAAIREHLAAKGLGLHNDLQDESSIVGNFPIIPALADYGTEEQKTYIEGIITGKTVECTFHFGTFDVTTGEPTGMPCEIALKTYPVTIVDGNVQIEV